MAKTKAFISFDFDHDHDKKQSLVAQASHRDSRFTFADSSLIEAVPDHEWVGKANRLIADADIFVLVLGWNTHTTPGVKREVSIAQGLNKRRFQLKAQGRSYAPLAEDEAGPVVGWTWKNLERWFSSGRLGGR